jgi:hypothetical protein
MPKKKTRSIARRHPRKPADKYPPSKTTQGAKPSPLPVHPWRVCPYGEHRVITHPENIPASKPNPKGSVTTRHLHCARNPSGKDQLYPDEIREISEQHFSRLKNSPCPLPLGFPNGGKYDDLIAGWVQYWNEVLQPDAPLEPNLVKALIASESRFIPDLLFNKKDSNSARGLTQITTGTRKILGNSKGELKDHLITVTKTDLNDPSVNICAGVRWIFQKKKLASTHLGRPASWLEAIREYKGASIATKPRAKQLMARFEKYYGDCQKCGK